VTNAAYAGYGAEENCCACGKKSGMGKGPSAKTCHQLGWASPRSQVDGVCGESDVDGACTRQHYAAAVELCEGVGARMCTIEEIHGDVTRGTGCNFDFERVWSSSPCDGGVWTQAGASSHQSKAARRCSDTNEGLAVRCCADEGTEAPTAAPTTPAPSERASEKVCTALNPNGSDQWCAANCATGYCPMNYCKCVGGDARPKVCKSLHARGDHQWCGRNCAQGYCPADYCICELEGEEEKAEQECSSIMHHGDHGWCRKNCGEGYCPENYCKCEDKKSEDQQEEEQEEEEAEEDSRFERLGTGYCKKGLYAGWNQMEATLAQCRELCAEERECEFFALAEGRTCSRFNRKAKNCSGKDRIEDSTHVLFLKK
jgi:hypothetical protein